MNPNTWCERHNLSQDNHLVNPRENASKQGGGERLRGGFQKWNLLSIKIKLNALVRLKDNLYVAMTMTATQHFGASKSSLFALCLSTKIKRKTMPV